MALDGDYTPDSEDEIFARLTDTAQEIDPTLAVGDGTINNALLRTIARIIADNQEQALDELYDSTYLETATGVELERRARDIGITRNDAVPATGVVEMGRENETTGTFTIPRNTLVQPPGSDVITFQTTDSHQIGLLDGYESGVVPSGYSGDTDTLSVIDDGGLTDSGDPDTIESGQYALEIAPQSGTNVFNGNVDVTAGDTIHYSIYLRDSASVKCSWHVQDTANKYHVVIDVGNNTLTAKVVDNGSTQQLTTESTTIDSQSWYTLEVDTTVNTDTNVTLLDANGNGVNTLTFSDDTYRTGHVGLGKTDTTAPTYVDLISRTVTASTIEATEGTDESNVSAESISEFVSKPTGITFVTNRVSTGDPQYETVAGKSLTTGVDRESDEELRNRALDATSIGGAATISAVGRALRDINDVVSVNIVENKTLNDNTGSGGLPPLSIEPVIFGGNQDRIFETLFEQVAATERLHSGVNGTSVSGTVYSQTLQQDVPIEFSRPTKVDVTLTLDIVVGDAYVGDEAIRDRLVEYIGGRKTTTSEVNGLGIGVDIRIDALRDLLVGDETDIRGISSVSATPSISTNSNGLDIISIDENEVSRTDAIDGSITLNVTEV